MLQVEYTRRMKRDVRLMKRRGRNLKKLETVIDLLIEQNPLPREYHDHPLTGDLSDFRECHIEPDWLLMYQVFADVLVLSLTATGTHADLFGK